MSFISTLQLLTALKPVLAGIPHPAPPVDAPGEKLFARVEFWDSQLLAEAIKNLAVAKQRVCFIVPEGEDYETVREGQSVIVYRSLSFNLLIADRAWTKDGYGAAFGGPNNLGVLAMKDLVCAALLGEATLGLPHAALAPTGGNFIEASAQDVKDAPGRECYVLSWATPAGDHRYTYRPLGG
jgi:hypothetical protein